jgi:hypothetical protein
MWVECKRHADKDERREEERGGARRVRSKVRKAQLTRGLLCGITHDLAHVSGGSKR